MYIPIRIEKFNFYLLYIARLQFFNIFKIISLQSAKVWIAKKNYLTDFFFQFRS